MFHQTESKAQGWRAMAIFDDGSHQLLFVGRSSTQVRAGYASAFSEMLDDDEQDQVRSIQLQRWEGAPDAGKWKQQTTLNKPGVLRAVKIA